MVLEMRAPHGTNEGALRPLIPILLSYVLSFIFLGIYWSNHHHLLQAVKHVNAPILWANLQLLFWLSLIPFVTNWMGETHFAAWPVALYGAILTFAAVAYFFLARALVSLHGEESMLGTALGRDFKGKISIVICALAIPLAFVKWWVACALYVLIAIMWLVPDRRIEKTLIS